MPRGRPKKWHEDKTKTKTKKLKNHIFLKFKIQSAYNQALRMLRVLLGRENSGHNGTYRAVCKAPSYPVSSPWAGGSPSALWQSSSGPRVGNHISLSIVIRGHLPSPRGGLLSTCFVSDSSFLDARASHHLFVVLFFRNQNNTICCNY